ncbi:MAG: chemotaxis protein CheB [Chloroflexota bacterium]
MLDNDREETAVSPHTLTTYAEKPAFIVGIGASAGGLEALEKFFTSVEPRTQLAFVVVQHLSPDYKSLMVELLSKHTTLPVYETTDGMIVKPNAVYLIPRKKTMTIFHGRLLLADRKPEEGLHLPIDIFLKSLAEDQGEKAIAIILSGTGSDGTRGIRAVKEAGGMVMAQDEQSARFDGMPRSAIATQLVDYVLSPEQMPQELMKFVQHPYLVGDARVKPPLTDDDNLNKIFALLRSFSGVDFSFYKQNTMGRRIERRMSINQIDRLSDYLNYLYRSQAEVNTLYKEMLIGVTRFFRDPEAFEELRTVVIPAILANKDAQDQVRVWVVGCSTGEEAYSLAILFREAMEAANKNLDVKIFATDIDKEAIDFASRGIYSESVAADVSHDQLRRYFIKKSDSYEIMRHVREMVIFARQNLIKDPPFSKIDLISCRNVLIYFQVILQKRVLAIFQFALQHDGFLFLGTSETVGSDQEAFFPFHNKWRIYQYKGGVRPLLQNTAPIMSQAVPPAVTHSRAYALPFVDERRAREHTLYRTILEQLLAPALIVNEQLELLHAFGDINRFLQVPSGGRVSLSITKMLRADLSIPFSTAIHRVLKEQEEAIYNNVVVRHQDGVTVVDLLARPFTEPVTRQRLAFVQFREAERKTTDAAAPESYDRYQGASQRIKDLEQELQYTRESLQATIEELETSNEELQATNEELLAANEELQSTNEELQSVNEELITVNAEYQAKIQELTELNNDMSNLLGSTDIGTIFLDIDLHVRKFTPAIQREINLIDSDINRPISHISHNIEGCDLMAEAEIVLDTLVSRQRKVRDRQGKWFILKVMPYRTQDNAIRGVVMTLVDITELEMANQQIAYQENVLRKSPHAIISVDHDLRIVNWNQAAQTLFGFTFQEAVGKEIETVLRTQYVSERREQVLTAVHESGLWSGEIRQTSKNGTVLPILALISTIKNHGEQQTGMVWVNRLIAGTN